MSHLLELLQQAEKQLAIGHDHMYLSIPKGTNPRTLGFGAGSLRTVGHDGSRLYVYKASRVKAAILKLAPQIDIEG